MEYRRCYLGAFSNVAKEVGEVLPVDEALEHVGIVWNAEFLLAHVRQLSYDFALLLLPVKVVSVLVVGLALSARDAGVFRPAGHLHRGGLVG